MSSASFQHVHVHSAESPVGDPRVLGRQRCKEVGCRAGPESCRAANEMPRGRGRLMPRGCLMTWALTAASASLRQASVSWGRRRASEQWGCSRERRSGWRRCRQLPASVWWSWSFQATPTTRSAIPTNVRIPSESTQMTLGWSLHPDLSGQPLGSVNPIVELTAKEAPWRPNQQVGRRPGQALRQCRRPGWHGSGGRGRHSGRLLGPNGAGKTTVVRILTTLLKADAGHATVGGIDVAKKPNEVRRTIGLTGQYAAVDEYLTGRENIEMVGGLYHLKPPM